MEVPHAFYSAPIAGATANRRNHLEQFLSLDNMNSNHLRSERNRLAELKALPENWDGNGSAKASEVAAERTAEVILPALYDTVSSLSNPWAEPHITVSESGDIVLEWWKGDRKITMYISDQQVEYIKVWGANIETEMEATCLEDVTEFRATWDWLFE
jgi:hypothetical protein